MRTRSPMTPALAFLVFASLATLAAALPRLVRGRTEPILSGTAFVAFALWAIYGDLTGRAAIIAVGTLGIIVTAIAMSTRALLGSALRHDRPSASRA